MNVVFDRVNRLFHNELDAHRGREVKDDVTAIDELGQEGLVAHRVDEVLEAAAALQFGDVVHRAGRQVVEDQHVVSSIQQRFREVRADESRSACNQCPHRASPSSTADATSATS